VLTLRGATPRETARAALCADIDGFSLHAAVRVAKHTTASRRNSCAATSPGRLSDERVQLNAAGQVELKPRTPWRDGTTHLVMSAPEFMQRPAALATRLRLHLIRFHGALAPNAKLRPRVVPQGPQVQEQAEEVAVANECEVETVLAPPRPAPRRISHPPVIFYPPFFSCWTTVQLKDRGLVVFFKERAPGDMIYLSGEQECTAGSGATGRDKLVAVQHDAKWHDDPLGQSQASISFDLTFADGEREKVDVFTLPAHYWLKGGLYGGLDGWFQGDERGKLFTAHDTWNVVDAATRTSSRPCPIT